MRVHRYFSPVRPIVDIVRLGVLQPEPYQSSIVEHGLANPWWQGPHFDAIVECGKISLCRTEFANHVRNFCDLHRRRNGRSPVACLFLLLSFASLEVVVRSEVRHCSLKLAATVILEAEIGIGNETSCQCESEGTKEVAEKKDSDKCPDADLPAGDEERRPYQQKDEHGEDTAGDFLETASKEFVESPEKDHQDERY